MQRSSPANEHASPPPGDQPQAVAKLRPLMMQRCRWIARYLTEQGASSLFAVEIGEARSCRRRRRGPAWRGTRGCRLRPATAVPAGCGRRRGGPALWAWSCCGWRIVRFWQRRRFRRSAAAFEQGRLAPELVADITGRRGHNDKRQDVLQRHWRVPSAARETFTQPQIYLTSRWRESGSNRSGDVGLTDPPAEDQDCGQRQCQAETQGPRC